MIERIIRAVAGTLVLVSIVLSLTVSLNWLWLGGFVGFNLLQSSITGFCPLEYLLKKKATAKRN
ncbi:MAG: hypothetical protein H6Q17_1775 [Bacteroidetes bacterium]|jgi:hypothetical protein|nr:hypothetical protein [Bacteroidota bacterium]